MRYFNSHENILSSAPIFLFSTISLSSSHPDVSHGEHDREAGELWCSKTGRAAQFTATVGSSTVQLPLAATFSFRRHPSQRQGALRMQVKCGAACYFPALIKLILCIMLHKMFVVSVNYNTKPSSLSSTSFLSILPLQVLWENLPPFGKPHQTFADTHRGTALQVFYFIQFCPVFNLDERLVAHTDPVICVFTFLCLSHCSSTLLTSLLLMLLFLRLYYVCAWLNQLTTWRLLIYLLFKT